MSWCIERLGLSGATAVRELNKLLQKDLIIKIGQGKNIKYRAKYK